MKTTIAFVVTFGGLMAALGLAGCSAPASPKDLGEIGESNRGELPPRREDGEEKTAPASDRSDRDELPPETPGTSTADGIESKANEPRFTNITYFARNEGLPIYLAHFLGTPKAHLFSNVAIENPTDATVKVELRGSLQGYTKSEATATITLAPKEKKTGFFDATLDFAALNALASPVPAAFNLKLLVNGNVVSSWSKTVQLLPKNTVFWTANGQATQDFATMSAVMASLTTPHDKWQEIDKLLQSAAKYSKFGAMIGYQYQQAGRTVDQDVADALDQVGAIFNALKAMGVNYSSVSEDFFTGSQNVRFPSESLRAKTANCIDGSLVVAAAAEAMGMEPQIVTVPGHAFVGVRAGKTGTESASRIIMVETTVISGKTFDEANKLGIAKYNATPATSRSVFDIAALRKNGLLPSPFPL